MRYLVAHHRPPRPVVDQPDHTLPGTAPFTYAGTDDPTGTPDPALDAQRLTLMSVRLRAAAGHADVSVFLVGGSGVRAGQL
jgi:hypothetical protein